MSKHSGNRVIVRAILATVVFWGWHAQSLAARADEKKGAEPNKSNRLAKESSPYLLQHAHNPVDWYPWGPEAFAKAKSENKLIFLSVGYSSCHWCHVMERESFENTAVAKLLNDSFVCIKVDREERPDIDAIYMAALSVQGQRGGWPLSMFLTEEGKPIVGGTYWPADDRPLEGGKMAAGFKSILRKMNELQSKQSPLLHKHADSLAAATSEALALSTPGRAIVPLDRKLISEVLDAIKEEFDDEYGGFGLRRAGFRGTKFPTPPYLELLLARTKRSKETELVKVIAVTLDHMARGGIYDQLGGGFHRYSTERTWTVPHFEKMLYDNAQLVEIYAEAFVQTSDPLYRRVVNDTLAFIGRELTDPEGGFYSALDADSDGVEGRFYVWTPEEIDRVLSNKADADLVKKVYGLDARPNFDEKEYILVQSKSLARTAHDLGLTENQLSERLRPLRAKLLTVRFARPRPFLDTKILTGWNGQMIAAYAIAGQALGKAGYLETAAHAADFVLTRLRTKEGRLLRSYNPRASQPPKSEAYLDDYAYLVHGLLCLHDGTHDARWLKQAKILTDIMIASFQDKEAGGFFYTANEHEKLFARSKDQSDGAQPSGNSMAARNLVRLWKKTGDERYRASAEECFKSFAGTLKASPTSMTGLCQALELYLDEKEPSKAPSAIGLAVVSLAQKGDSTKSDSKIKATVRAEPKTPGAGGKQVITVTLKIEEGWHIYANPAGDDSFTPTEVSVSSKSKMLKAKLDYPKGKLVEDRDLKIQYRIYEDKAEIKASIERPAGDADPLTVSVKLQACNDKECLFPATIKLTVPEK